MSVRIDGTVNGIAAGRSIHLPEDAGIRSIFHDRFELYASAREWLRRAWGNADRGSRCRSGSGADGAAGDANRAEREGGKEEPMRQPSRISGAGFGTTGSRWTRDNAQTQGGGHGSALWDEFLERGRKVSHYRGPVNLHCHVQ